MSIQNDFNRIKEKMEQLKNHPKKEKLFGSGLDKSMYGHNLYDHIKTGHEYQLEPTLSKEQISEWENYWDAKLPEDYQLFITEIGNGGMGPFYGLFPLELDPEKQENHLEGTICLAHEGCGYFHHLGFASDKRNKLYVDLEVIGEGIHEINCSSFFEWYEAWLDDSLETLNRY